MKRVSGAACAVAVVLVACGGGGGDDGGGGNTRCTPSGAATMTLASSGVAPKAVCVLPGGTVTFVNQDSVQHNIVGDAGCSGLAVGVIAPQATTRVTLQTAQVCTFRDAATNNAAFQGTVAVTDAPAEGPGY